MGDFSEQIFKYQNVPKSDELIPSLSKLKIVISVMPTNHIYVILIGTVNNIMK